MLTTYAQNNINFTSIPITSISYRKNLLSSPVTVVFSKLDRDNSIDRNAVAGLKKAWPQCPKLDNVTERFVDNFLDNRKKSDFYVIESTEKEGQGERIIALMELEGNDLANLKVKPGLNKGRFFTKIKGLGQILLAMACNIMQIRNLKDLRFHSVNDPFYLHVFKRAKMVKCKDYTKSSLFCVSSDFLVYQSGLTKLLNYVREKYKISFPTQV